MDLLSAWIRGSHSFRKNKKISCFITVVTLVVLIVHNIELNNNIDALEMINPLDGVKRVDTWKNGIRFAQWDNPAETDKEYLDDWVDTLASLIEPGIVTT